MNNKNDIITLRVGISNSLSILYEAVTHKSNNSVDCSELRKRESNFKNYGCNIRKKLTS